VSSERGPVGVTGRLRGFFVAGTDTGVGKTEVARALLAVLAEAGARPLALKPVETGCAPEAPQDALALRAACGAPGDALPLDRVCPHRFRLPAAPLVAAEAEGAEVSMLRILECVQAAALAGAPLVVEAAGGLLVPLARAGDRIITNLDLARTLGLPVVLVGRAGLGTLNHCALSVEALIRRAVPIAGIVLNRTAREDDPSVATIARWLAELTGLQAMGPTPFQPDAVARPAALRPFVAPIAARLAID
jgi:dethiobiotin synthetase